MKTNIHIETGRMGEVQRPEYANFATMVTHATAIEIEINYPCGKPLIHKARSKSGFTLSQFMGAVQAGYRKVYKNAKKYGVWGHSLSDLYLEGVTEVAPTVFELSVGS